MTGRFLKRRESCVPLLPVITGTRRGLLRMLNMIGRWTQGTRKCVPSPDTVGNTPLNRSKITALSPPSTVGKVDENTVASHAIHYAVIGGIGLTLEPLGCLVLQATPFTEERKGLVTLQLTSCCRGRMFSGCHYLMVLYVSSQEHQGCNMTRPFLSLQREWLVRLN